VSAPDPESEFRDVIADINAAAAADDEARVYALAKAALDRGLQHPMLFHARANWFWHEGLYYDALNDIQAALDRTPRNPLLQKAAGECLLKLGVWKAAARAFGEAVAIAPNMPQAHYLRGLAFQMSGERKAALAAHIRAIELMPHHADALGSLALISVAENAGENVRLYAGRAHALDSAQPSAHIALALLELNEAAIEAAQQRVEKLLAAARFGDDPRANEVLREIGDHFARLGNLAFAFRIYADVNRRRRAIHARRFATNRSSIPVALQTLYFQRAQTWPASRVTPSRPDAPTSHVFVLGFARTGTTLLETVLAANEQAVVLDEKDCFPEEARALLNGEDGLEALASADETRLIAMRDAYWEKVREFGRSAAGKVFVDKWPFNSRRLPLIARLFPEARILFMIRDPRDVVLSCFRRSFIMNADTFEFLELEDCARFYCAIMELAAGARKKLPLQILDVRYENLVTEFDGTVSTICDFVGLRRDEAMRDFRHAADGAVDVYAQSGKQVRMGLYSGAEGQWRLFQDQLAAALPILGPWVERLGYSFD
jgi:tetratricopeptide (TPR) repeat protein